MLWALFKIKNQVINRPHYCDQALVPLICSCRWSHFLNFVYLGDKLLVWTSSILFILWELWTCSYIMTPQCNVHYSSISYKIIGVLATISFINKLIYIWCQNVFNSCAFTTSLIEMCCNICHASSQALFVFNLFLARYISQTITSEETWFCLLFSSTNDFTTPQTNNMNRVILNTWQF